MRYLRPPTPTHPWADQGGLDNPAIDNVPHEWYPCFCWKDLSHAISPEEGGGMMSGANILYFIILGVPFVLMTIVTGLCLGFSIVIAKGNKLMLVTGLAITLGMVLVSVYMVFYMNGQEGVVGLPPLPGGLPSWIIGYFIVMPIAAWRFRYLMLENKSQEVG